MNAQMLHFLLCQESVLGLPRIDTAFEFDMVICFGIRLAPYYVFFKSDLPLTRFFFFQASMICNCNCSHQMIHLRKRNEFVDFFLLLPVMMMMNDDEDEAL